METICGNKKRQHFITPHKFLPYSSKEIGVQRPVLHATYYTNSMGIRYYRGRTHHYQLFYTKGTHTVAILYKHRRPRQTIGKPIFFTVKQIFRDDIIIGRPHQPPEIGRYNLTLSIATKLPPSSNPRLWLGDGSSSPTTPTKASHSKEK